MKKILNKDIYCIWNIIYQYYGKNIHKLGCSYNADKRLTQYTTSYIEPSKLLYKSNFLSNKMLAESILFDKLNDYRVSSHREFFNCDIEIIKSTINEINVLFEEHTEEQINKMFYGDNKMTDRSRSSNIYTLKNILNAPNIDVDKYKC